MLSEGSPWACPREREPIVGGLTSPGEAADTYEYRHPAGNAVDSTPAATYNARSQMTRYGSTNFTMRAPG